MDLAEAIRTAPKVALHDHLDGGLRPATVLELAPDAGVALAADTPEGIARWFFDQADSGSLAAYLTTFDVTVALMQTAANLRRIAKEFVLDQAADGVVYAEARWAPVQHTRAGLSLEDAVRAVRDGLADGMDETARAGHPVVARQLLCELRGTPATTDIAELAIAYRDDSVAGLDCAGPELGHPAGAFAAGWELARRAHLLVTIHAGEADGPDSIAEALACGAHRIGHGVRLAEDLATGPGRLAAYIATLGIPLEVCPTSNLQTGVAPDLAHHPFDTLYRAGVRVTVNCDNRLMSDTTLTREFVRLASTKGYGLDDVRRLTLNAAWSAFLPYPQKRELVERVRREWPT